MPSVGLAMIVQRPAPEGSSVFSFSLGSLLLREVHKAEQAVLRFYEIIIFVLAGLKAQIWSGIPPGHKHGANSATCIRWDKIRRCSSDDCRENVRGTVYEVSELSTRTPLV